MAPLKTAIAALLLSASPFAFADTDTHDANSHELSFAVAHTSATLRRSIDGLAPRKGGNFCSGRGVTCQSCFGDDYQECPDGSNCWNPDDPKSTCSGKRPSPSEKPKPSSPIPKPSKPAPTSPGGGTSRRFCKNGHDCESCFGPGYKLCPASLVTCYNPDAPRSTCKPKIGGGGGDDHDKLCVEQFGKGFKTVRQEELLQSRRWSNLLQGRL